MPASGAGRPGGKPPGRRSRAHPFGLAAALLLPLALVVAETSPGLAPGTLDARPCESRPGLGPEMILIEAAAFLMGSPPSDSDAESDEKPQHRVTLTRPFALARCETTVGEFRRFVAETGYVTEAERGGGCYTIDAAGTEYTQRRDAHWQAPGFPQTDAHPVVCVSFNDARAYARWLSLGTGADYRLPSEAEWEFAARGGTTKPRFWGEDRDLGCAYANGPDRTVLTRFPGWTTMACDDGALFTAPAGSYRRNAFGLSDLLGNALEWVQDCWHDSYTGAPSDGGPWGEAGSGDCTLRVLRGGSWTHDPRWLRSAYRNWNSADAGNDNVGFRLARTL